MDFLKSITHLRRDDKIELSCLFLFTLITLSILFLSTTYIPLIIDDRAYVPDELDYLRTCLLASISSLIINYSYRFFSKKTIIFKIPLEFLFFYLLAYPQTQEKSRTYSKFNLTIRQSALYAITYQTVSLLFYLIDEIKFLIELGKEKEKDLEQLSKANDIRSKSTLSNCLQIRRNSNSLRKILYPESYIPEVQPVDEESELLINYESGINSTATTSSNADDSLLAQPRIEPIISYGSITSLLMLQSNSQQLNDMDTESRFLLKEKFKYQSFALHLIWIISSSFYELGICLLLSLPFIYIPGLTNGHQFSSLQIFFYGKISLFFVEVVIPMSLLVSTVYYQIYANFKSVYSSIFIYICVSSILFMCGWCSS